MKPFFLSATLCLSLACANQATKPVPQKHYPLTGKVVSVDAKDRTADIDAAAIPHFMEAMTMGYPIQSKDEFAMLHPGDHITATVDVNDDGSYSLSHIKIVPAPAAPTKK